MKKGLFILLLVQMVLVTPLFADQGLVSKSASGSVAETADRLAAMLDANPAIRVLARVDHAANAQSVNKQLSPTTLIIFGNPVLGTELMKENQMAGIDLPMKILIWQDASGKTQMSYNDPAWIAQRHGLTTSAPVIKKMSGALNKITNKAAGTQE
jgi:uncharacterized protein (DUF302 family)